MKEYLTKKVVKAEKCRAWGSFGRHKQGEPGYKVIYPDGYVSWCPEKEFEEHAQELRTVMSFGDVLQLLFDAPEMKFAREGWNGKGMFIFLMPGKADEPYAEAEKLVKEPDGRITRGAYLAISTKYGVIPWVPSQADLMGCDWAIVVTDKEVKEQGWKYAD